jgi:hypothetical protein
MGPTRAQSLDFLGEHTGRVDLTTVAVNLAITGVLAYLLGLLYVRYGRSPSNRRAFAEHFLLISLTTAIIIVVVKSSLALSLGLVGALSIVRFRSAVREHEELAFLFVAIALGLSLGADQRALALIGFAAIATVLVLRHHFRPRIEQENLYLKLQGPPAGEDTVQRIADVLADCCTLVKLKRCDITDGTLEASFQVVFENLEDLTRAQNQLRAEMPVSTISVLDGEGIV